MKTHDFWYDLPEELIAQTPLEKRDTSRMLALDRETGAIAHRHFYDIIDYLNPGDCLVMNDSRVCGHFSCLPLLPASAVNIKYGYGNKKDVGETFCCLSLSSGLRIALLPR